MSKPATQVSHDLATLGEKDLETVLRGAMKDKQGRYRTRSLFWEYKVDGYDPVFTLKEYDYKGCLSLRRKYLEIADPTEYEFAKRMFASWEHWDRIKDVPWFNELLEDWRKELNVKLNSEMYHNMKQVVDKDPCSSLGVGATKFIHDNYVKRKAAPKRGRPTKEEVKGAVKQAAKSKSEYEDDAARIGLSDDA